MAPLQPPAQEHPVDRWDDITGDHEDDLADILPTLQSPATRVMRDMSTGGDHRWDTREQHLLRVIDVLHRKNKHAEAAYRREVEAVKNWVASKRARGAQRELELIDTHAGKIAKPMATQYAHNEIVSADFRARLSLHKYLIDIRERERVVDDKLAQLTAQEAALALEKTSLDDQRLAVQHLLDRISDHPLAPPNFRKVAERHYLSGMKRTIDADKAQAEKTRRDYEHRLQQLNEDEKHCETIKQLVEGLDTMTDWTEYQKDRESAVREKIIGSGNKKYDNPNIFESDTSADVAISKKQYDSALLGAAEEGAIVEVQRAMLNMAAYHLMFEKRLPREEEDSRWAWLRHGDEKEVQQHPVNWASRIGYELQMHLLYQTNNVTGGVQRHIIRNLEAEILQRPTGVLPDAMENWFDAIEDGAEEARAEFQVLGETGRLPKG